MAIPSITGKRAVRASAEDSSAFGQIAERFRRAGELERAVNLCREGLQRFPDQVSARVTLGWALLELGKYDEARGELEQVLRRRPDNLAAIRALAELHDRSEQTLNLPMDGPGQWPPSEEVVDQAATNLADADLLLRSDGIEEPVLIHPPSQPAAGIVGSASLRDAAIVAPPELGLAMWSALPDPEPAPAPEPSFGYMLNDRTAALAAAAAPGQESVGAEVDLAALIAEADSLDAVAEADADDLLVDPPMMVLDATGDEPVADLVAGPAFAVPDARTLAAYSGGAADVAIESPSDGPAVFQFQSTPLVHAAPEELTAGGVIEPELIVAPLAAREAEVIATEPAVELVTGPKFELLAQSIAEVELASVALAGEDLADAHLLQLGAVSVDQTALDFETVPVDVPHPAAVVPSLRPADVVTMIRPAAAVEPVRSPVPALERLLARVQARRQHLMTESVA